MEKMNKHTKYSRTDGWRNTEQYRRMMELLDEYWLDDPSEAYVDAVFTFVNKDGQRRTAHVWWNNPSMAGWTQKAVDQKKNTLQRKFEMPRGIGEWDAEDKKVFYIELAKWKGKFYEHVTAEILKQRRRRNGQGQPAEED